MSDSSEATTPAFSLALAGKYRLLRKLAVGGMAEVFLAKAAGPRGFEKTLVIKRILPHLAADPAFVGLFLREAQVAGQLNHPNLVQVFDFGEFQDTYYLVMEFIDGPTLSMLRKGCEAAGERLPVSFCARIISQACEGLAYAHEFADPETGKPLELVHRDLSPDNILVSRSGVVKVVDFGVAKSAGAWQRTETGALKGKIAYMAPEQIRGTAVDRRADVYCLGVVLYELVTGRRPFDAPNEVGRMYATLNDPLPPVARYREDAPAALQQILERALAKSPEGRYASCRDFAADLAALGEPLTVKEFARGVAAWGGPPVPQTIDPRLSEPLPVLDLSTDVDVTRPRETPQVFHREARHAPAWVGPAVGLLLGTAAGGAVLYALAPERLPAAPRVVAVDGPAPPAARRESPVESESAPPPPVAVTTAPPIAAPPRSLSGREETDRPRPRPLAVP
ncbi:MAG TPA: protein kinase, partial [Myxococcaceae bacterium]|nr:protein kinase [Myxococcaceae bacterium]